MENILKTLVKMCKTWLIICLVLSKLLKNIKIYNFKDVE